MEQKPDNNRTAQFLKNLTISASLIYISVVFASIIYQNILLRLFQIESSAIFEVSDYLKASLSDGAIGVFLFLSVTMAITRLFITKDNLDNKLSSENLKSILKTMFGISLVLIGVGGVALTLLPHYAIYSWRAVLYLQIAMYLGFGAFAIWLSIFFSSKIEKEKLGQKACFIIFTMLLFLIATSEYALLKRKLADKGIGCNYEVATRDEFFEKSCIITSSKQYLVIFSREKEAIIIPQSEIRKISTQSANAN